MPGIFERSRLSASQLRTVAKQRYDDAECLRESGKNARANGVFYLGGFVIECLLKARLLAQYPTVAAKRNPAELSKSDRVIWKLIFVSHELDAMLSKLPDISTQMQAAKSHSGAGALANLNRICGEWTIFARYSTQSATMHEASRFLDNIKELIPWLEQ